MTLPDFSVRGSRAGSYGATEATSTTRIRLPIQDIAQTITVVTRELIADTHSLRMIDAAKFATPIFESTTSAGDAYSVRGFRTLQRFIDGVNVGSLANSMWSDQTNIERIEITKGPNAILVPGGGFGGMMNQITKSPTFTPFARLTLRARSYLGSEASLDGNHVFEAAKGAMRIVATRWDATGYFQGEFRRGWLLAPSLIYRLSGDTELRLKAESVTNRESNGMGVEIAPTVGTRTGGYARKHPLLPRNNLWSRTSEPRWRKEDRFTAELRTPVGRNVASRVWLMLDQVGFITPGVGGGASADGAQGGRNPLSGEWEPFRRFTYDYATGAVASATLTPGTSTIFSRTNRQLVHAYYDEVHFRNDYASEYSIGPDLRSATVGGLSANRQISANRNWRVTFPPVDFATGRIAGSDTPVATTLVRDKQAEQRDVQAFVYQRVTLWTDRLIVSAGLSTFHGTLKRLDDTGLPPTLAGQTRNNVTDSNLGAIYKPRPEISLFAGYNRLGGALPQSAVAGEFAAGSFKVGQGEQREFGVKTSWFHRITASAAWFEITQLNAQVNNSAFPSDPAQTSPFSYVELRNRGWEFEFNVLVNPGLQLIGNVTHMRMRNFNGTRVTMVPDKAGAIFAKYTGRNGRSKGFGASLGVEYVGAVAGDGPSTFFTEAGVPAQPSFYLAPRTLLQAGMSYKRDRWSLGVMVHNLANEDYIQSSSSRTVLLPGEPRNVSLTLELHY